MAEIEIRELSVITPEAVQSLANLVRQLSASATLPTRDDFEQIARSPATILLVARQSDRIVGMLTLVVFRIPTGIRGIIEDVVVDETHRGQGIAAALTNVALARAHAAGVRTVDLTSRPSREAANHLYQKLGFQRRESNLYRFTF